jgi:hypothetical protein
MKRIGILTSLMVWVSLGWTGTAQGDAVTDWNVIAVQTIVNAGAAHSSAVSFLDNATVQVAIYDAVEAYSGKFRPYHVHVTGASGSPVAAVAAAAHDVLVNRFPAQAALLDLAYQAYLANHGLFECISRRRSAWCTKAELSDRADSETPKEAPPCNLCITSDWMFTRRRSVTA